MLFGHPIAVSGFNGSTVPIQVIDLELNNIHLRVGRQNFIQQSGAVMVGNADFLCLSCRFQFPKKGKLMMLFTHSIVCPIQPMK